MNRKPNTSVATAELRHRAEGRLRERQGHQRSDAAVPKSTADSQRLLHELQVHQVELEMQNAELQKARDELEAALEKYTDLYDFAPVGYFSLDEQGRILEANLTSAALLGVERSRLINRRLLVFVSPASRTGFLAFLGKAFTEPKDQACEALLLKEGGGTLWAAFRATSAVSPHVTGKWCRVAFGDITDRKQAEEAQHRLDALAVANRELTREIVRRQAVEKSLKKSEQHYALLFEQSRHMQDQLRLLSRQVMSAQEEERKKISRELHDVIAQTLTGINIQLAALKIKATLKSKGLERSIGRTQQLVVHSVNIIHRFARELRPTVLDDLGLIPALHAFMKTFSAETGIRVSLSAFAAIKQVNSDKRTVLYRVAQEALTNVARHAQASRAEVTIRKLNGAICMAIKDNGKGFPQSQGRHDPEEKRLGLVGMRERLEMVGGSLTVTSAPGKGTTLLAKVPLIDRKPAGGGGEAALMKGCS
jgi:PAS domain S-box-containing protein